MPYTLAAGTGKDALQWSRPQLRTETCALPVLHALDRIASMEPSSAEDGNLSVLESSSVSHQRFNGAVLS